MAVMEAAGELHSGLETAEGPADPTNARMLFNVIWSNYVAQTSQQQSPKRRDLSSKHLHTGVYKNTGRLAIIQSMQHASGKMSTVMLVALIVLLAL